MRWFIVVLISFEAEKGFMFFNAIMPPFADYALNYQADQVFEYLLDEIGNTAKLKKTKIGVSFELRKKTSGGVMGECSKKEGAGMELIDEGYIIVGGGCEVYHTGKIIFRPKGETIEVRVENSGRYFAPHQDPDQPIKDFKIILAAKKIAPFFIRLKHLLDHPQKRHTFSTIKAKAEIFLPFKAEKLDVKLKEMDGTLPFDDPILDEIRTFVLDCSRNPNKTL